MMVQSRPHHLRHQWSQISTVVFILFLNHIHHHTYFKSSYLHIQVFPILHHHNMKLLLAFKSFLPRRLIVGIGSETEFRCAKHKSAANINSLQQVQLRQRNRISLRKFSCGSETEFRCAAANINSLQQVQLRQRNRISLQQVQLRQRNRISLRNTQIGSEYQFAAAGSVAAAKQNFAAQHTNRQRIST